MNFNWRIIFVVLAGILAVVVLAGFTDWDAIKVLAICVLALAVACFPSNA